MPDVKWYSGSGGSTFSVSITPAAADGAGLGTSAIPWSDLFLASGAVINFNAANVTVTHSAATLTVAGLTSGLVLNQTDANEALELLPGSNPFIGPRGQSTSNYRFGWFQGSTTLYNVPTGGTHSFRVNNTAALTLSSTALTLASGVLLASTAGGQFASAYASAAVSLGIANLSVASPYLYINGVSGAGGNPLDTQLTAGSGVAIYTQAAHDAAATKFVVAYNLGGSMRYIVFTLDGSTTTFTNSATRP